MQRILMLIALCTLFVMPTATFAQDDPEDNVCTGLVYADGWVRPAIADGNTAIYGVIINLGAEDETLVSVESDIAKTFEVHESSMDDQDMMHMTPMTEGVIIPAGGFFELKPGAGHIMAIGTTEALAKDTEVEVTLNFENAGSLVATIPVHPEPMDMGHEMEMPAEPMPITTLNIENCMEVGFYGAWARPAIADGNTAIYGLALNLTEEEERLVSVSADIAPTIELHEVTMGEGDVMEMHPLEDGILIPPQSFALLQTGDLHVMVIGVEDALAEEDTFTAIFSFEQAGDLEVEVVVRSQKEMEGMSH